MKNKTMTKEDLEKELLFYPWHAKLKFVFLDGEDVKIINPYAIQHKRFLKLKDSPSFDDETETVTIEFVECEKKQRVK